MHTMSDRKAKHSTKYRHIQNNEPLWLLCDFGNKDVKAMIHANFGEEIWFPNAILKQQEHEWAALQADYKNRPAEYEQSAMFKLDNSGYIIGNLALEMSGSEQTKGAYKYKRDYIGALFVAVMMHLYPEGHKKINLVVTHPAELPSAALDRLRNSFETPFAIETVDGRKVEYTVKRVVTIAEPVAAFQTYVLNINGLRHQRRDFELKPGMTFAIEDTGGFISHLALGKVNRSGEIELASTNIKPIEYGVHHVITRFNFAMRDKFPQLSNHTSLPIERVTEALKTDNYRVKRAEMLPVSDVVEDAFAPLLTALRAVYEQPPFYNGDNLDGVILTAGGNALAQEFLTSHLFGDGFAFPAEDDVEQMRYCAIRGSSKGLVSFLAQKEAEREMRRNGTA